MWHRCMEGNIFIACIYSSIKELITVMARQFYTDVKSRLHNKSKTMGQLSVFISQWACQGSSGGCLRTQGKTVLINGTCGLSEAVGPWSLQWVSWLVVVLGLKKDRLIYHLSITQKDLTPALSCMTILHLVSSYPINLTTHCYYFFPWGVLGFEYEISSWANRFGHLVLCLWHHLEVEPCWGNGSLGVGLEAL